MGHDLDENPVDNDTRHRCFPDKKEQTLEDKLWNYNPFDPYLSDSEADAHDETDQGVCRN